MTPAPKFAWMLTQERIDLLAQELYKLQDLLNRAVPGCSEGDVVFCLLTDLRVQTVDAGAEDAFPFFPLTPRFPDTPVRAWPDPRIERAEERAA